MNASQTYTGRVPWDLTPLPGLLLVVSLALIAAPFFAALAGLRRTEPRPA